MLSDKEFNKKIGFLLGEKYRLDLKWKNIRHKKDAYYFSGATFSGPTMQFANRINPHDKILLDLYKQYYMFAKDVFIATFSWGLIEYLDDNVVLLHDAKLEYPNLVKDLPKLRPGDYIVINTTNHEAETHVFYPTYEAVVVNDLGEAYNFWRIHGSFRKV